MAVWTKGKRCGQDNCPSRFWTVIDGRQVCQHGHMSQTVEAAQDEEDEVRGRQIHIKKDAVARETTQESTVFGEAAFKRRFSALLLILKHQINFLTEKYALSKHFEHVVRTLFIKWANQTNLSLFGDSRTTPYSLNLLVLLRLGAHYVNAPVYFMDLLHHVKTGELAYMWPRQVPGVQDLLKDVKFIYSPVDQKDLPQLQPFQKLFAKMQAKLDLRPDPFDVRPLVLKLVRYLFLPPPVFTVAVRLLDFCRPSINVKDAETRAGACVWTALKLVYAFGQAKQIGDAPNWNVWSDLTRKYWNDKDWFWSADERDVESWDSSAEQEFLDFYRLVFGCDLVVPKSISQERLFAMLPLLKSYQKRSHQDDESVYDELFAALQSTRALTPHAVVETYRLHDDLTDLDPPSEVLQDCLCLLLGTTAPGLEEQMRIVERRLRLQSTK